MRIRHEILAVALLAFAAAVAIPLRGQSIDATDSFVIDSADGRRDAALVGDSQLANLLDDPATRFILQFANLRRDTALAPPPNSLKALFADVAERFAIQYANSRRNIALKPPGNRMMGELRNVGARFVLQYANSRRNVELSYPAQIISDHTPPQISSISAVYTSNGLLVTWTTDEFTVNTIEYGYQPGVYTDTVVEQLYERTHQLTIPLTGSGQELYFRIVSTDLNGNRRRSSEQKYVSQRAIFLPTFGNY